MRLYAWRWEGVGGDQLRKEGGEEGSNWDA